MCREADGAGKREEGMMAHVPEQVGAGSEELPSWTGEEGTLPLTAWGNLAANKGPFLF